MDNETGFWQWIESLSRSLGWEDRSVVREGHLDGDNGAHHLLPGWGHHPTVAPPKGPDLEAAHERGNRPKARIGKETGRDRSVYYDPDLPESHLANAHLTITGESGSGKTQAMKTILADLNGSGVPALVLDFKDDYAEPQYAAKEGFSVYDPTRRPLPFNPMEPLKDPQTGESNKVFHTYQLGEIVARVYGLGEQQQFKLREAIKGAYADAGDAIPTFDAVKDKLSADKGNSDIIARLSPIFDFGFFSNPDPQGFADIVSGNTVIRLSQLPSNEVKNGIAEFFLMGLYNYLVRLEQTHLLRQVLVLDEAWRVVQSPFLEPLMREARAFGLGVFVATQFPTDLPLAVSGSAATDLYFAQSVPAQVDQIKQTLTGVSNSNEAEQVGSVVRGLLPLQCVVHNQQYEPFVKVDARPYYARGFEAQASVEPEPDGKMLPKHHGKYNFNVTKHARDDESGPNFSWDEDGNPIDDYVENNCPACGQPMSYCQGHGEIGDPAGAATLDKHYDGIHEDCHPDGCDYPKRPFEYEACGDCDGTGTLNSNRYEPWGRMKGDTCDTCKGTGLSDNRTYVGKVAQEMPPSDYGQYICPHCQVPTDNPDGVCDACDDLRSTFVDADEQNLQDRIENAKQGAYERKTKDCISCGKRVHGNDYPLDNSNSELVADEYDMQGPPQAQCFMCANDEYMYTRGVEKAKKRWSPLPEGTPCTQCKGTGLRKSWTDEGELDTCYSCGGSGDRGNKTKTAEMQKFPPGEDDEGDNPFAPFSTSEWQMVKGPRYRRREG